MEKQKAKIIKASKTLQVKAGTGDVAPAALAKAEQAISANAEKDFVPLAEGFMMKLFYGIENARRGAAVSKELIGGMTRPVMELKANAKMFKYDLVTNLSNIVLDFLEALPELDENAIEIVDALHKSVSLILTKRMSGDGGAVGATLQKELQSAVERYSVKKKN